MSQFMNRFFFASYQEQFHVLGKSVKLLAKPARRDDARRIIELGFTKDKGKRRDKQVDVGDPQQFCVGPSPMLKQAFEQFRRVALFPDDVVNAVE